MFGALASEPFKVSDGFYGTGETFLFTFNPEFEVHCLPNIISGFKNSPALEQLCLCLLGVLLSGLQPQFFRLLVHCFSLLFSLMCEQHL